MSTIVPEVDYLPLTQKFNFVFPYPVVISKGNDIECKVIAKIAEFAGTNNISSKFEFEVPVVTFEKNRIWPGEVVKDKEGHFAIRLYLPAISPIWIASVSSKDSIVITDDSGKIHTFALQGGMQQT